MQAIESYFSQVVYVFKFCQVQISQFYKICASALFHKNSAKLNKVIILINIFARAC